MNIQSKILRDESISQAAAPEIAPATATEPGGPVAVDDLIVQARQMKPIAVYSSLNVKVHKTYAAMMRGQIKVQVELPYFVKLKGFFGRYAPEMKKAIARSWVRISEAGFVAPTKSRPDSAQYLDWLAERLKQPQGVLMTGVQDIFDRALPIPQVDAMLIQYMEGASESDAKILVAGTTDDEFRINMAPIVRQACATNDDQALGWLIFAAAQSPGYGFAESVLTTLTHIPGPMTRGALLYFIQSAQAFNETVETFTTAAAFKEINLKREFSPEPQTSPEVPVKAGVPAPKKPHPANQLTKKEGDRVKQMAGSLAQPSTDIAITQESVAALRSDIKQLVDAIEPGAELFAEQMSQLQALLQCFSTIDAQKRLLDSEAAGLIQQRQALRELAQQILDRISVIDEEAEIGLFTFVVDDSIDSSRMESARVELDIVATTIGQAEVTYQDLHECVESSPAPGSPKSEHIRRAQRMSALSATLNEGLLAIKELLKMSRFFALSQPDTAENATAPAEILAAQAQSSPSNKNTPKPALATAPAAEPSTSKQVVKASSPKPAAPKVIEVAVKAASPVDASGAIAPSPPVQPVIAGALPIAAAPIAVTLEAEVTEVAEIDHKPAALLVREIAMEDAYTKLSALMDARHYGLAGVYVDAIKAESKDINIATHAIILKALTEALESIDCNFVIDARLNPALRQLLTQGSSLNGLRPPTHVGVLAAGFVSAAFSSPQTSMPADVDALWTVIGPVRQALTGLSGVSGLIEHIVSGEAKGIALTREKFSASRIGSNLAQAKAIERSRLRAENWKKDHELHSSYAHHGFSRMHDHIYSNKHAIGQCLELISKNDLKGLKKAFEDAQGKFRKPAATVMEAFKQVGEKNKPDGRYNVTACENIEITERFIRSFLQGHDNGVSDKGILPHEIDYLTQLHAHLTRAMAEIEASLGSSQESMLEQIYAKSARTIFTSVLRLFDESGGPACVTVAQQKLLIQQPMDKMLNPSMLDSQEIGAKAVCTGASVMKTIDTLMDRDLGTLPSPISPDSFLKLLAEAQRSHLQAHRFLPALIIDTLLPRSYAKLDQPILQQYQKARADLTRDLQDARQRVTHAMALSALDQKDASQLLRIIESIHTSNGSERSIGHPEGSSSAYPDFPHAAATLQNQVLNVLDAQLEVAKNKLLTELIEYQETHGNESQNDVNRIRLMLSTNNPASIRTAHDACAILRNSGKLPAYVFNAGRNAPKEFDAFLVSLLPIRGQSGLLDSLEVALTSAEPKEAPQCILDLSVAARKEAAEFIFKWKEMCLSRGADAAENAGAFFSSMGISAPTYMPERTGRNLPSKFEFPDKAFAAISSTDCFIPPALGSAARMIVGYVVPGNQPDHEISALIQDVTSIPTFILSRASLTLTKRAKISRQVPVILIDDNLIAYMALHPEDRAHRMMEIAMLTFHTLPYSAEGFYVPKEMFFGRQRELISLRAVKNLAILYGGRRLGKSSLLAQIEREEDSVAGSAAIYIPMDRDYAGDDHVRFAWRKLYGGLVSRDVIEPMPGNGGETDWNKYRDWVEQQLLSESQKMRSCYLLFDEADNLMSHELDLLPEQTGFIRSLQQTAENVHSKFHLRYVIAGLHNLARMTTESNSALGKAETIALEPFSSDDDILRGVELVTKPMAALGFFFGVESEDLPLRILSVCNFYPAFIQIYCRKLLDHMYNKRGSSEAYANITAADLDAVERDHDLLAELQQKFSWTLDLDKRYKAIALILADYYYSEIEVGKNEGLTVSEIRMFCEMETPNHFQNMSAGAYEGLADEMRKLNVLEKNGSRYRLRNPSIAMLIGDRQRIELQLKSLAMATPERARNHGDRRNALLPRGNTNSNAGASASALPLFPMPVTWTHSNMECIDGNLVILGGNNLSGLVDITGARADWQLTQNAGFNALALSASAASAYITKIRRQGSTNTLTLAGSAGSSLPLPPPKGSKLLLASTSNAWKANEITQFISCAERASTSNIRLALVALPDRLYEIAQALENQSLTMSRGKKSDWSVAPVPAWSVDAVRFYLHDNNAVSDNHAACLSIIEASCGFGKQIQTICAGNLSVEMAMDLVEQAKTRLAPNLDVFYDKIGWPKVISKELRKRMEGLMGHINGEVRNGPSVDAYLDHFELKGTDLQFLNWMGLIQEGENNTWAVPKLYLRLLD